MSSTITLVSPSEGSDIAADTPIVFDVTEDVALGDIFVWVAYAGDWELVYALDAFSPRYAANSSAVETTPNLVQRFTVQRSGGWLGSPQIYVNEAEVSLHAITHRHGGDDEIDADTLAVSFVPSNSTPTVVAPYSDHVAQLASILNGLDLKDGELEAAVSAAQSDATQALSDATQALSEAADAQADATQALSDASDAQTDATSALGIANAAQPKFTLGSTISGATTLAGADKWTVRKTSGSGNHAISISGDGRHAAGDTILLLHRGTGIPTIAGTGGMTVRTPTGAGASFYDTGSWIMVWFESSTECHLAGRLTPT